MYKEAIPLVDKMYITEIHINVEDGDVFFPEFNENDYVITKSETLGDEIKYTRTVYVRKQH